MRVLQAIFLSLAIHFLLVLLIQSMPVSLPKHTPITFDIIETDPQSRVQKQIVREQLVPDSMKVTDSNDPAKFLSATDQRVKKETIAANNGMTKNRGGQTEQKSKPQKTQQDPRQPNPIDAFNTEYKKNILSQNRMNDPGLSTVGESIEDVAVGSFTALNTDRHLYYSFYSRIEELIRYRWESGIMRAINTTPPTSFEGSNYNWTTNLEIWLKPNGEYHSAHIMKESGIRGFDQAAVQAFASAGLFPNPPKDMVGADGVLRLKYSFRVYHQPKLLTREKTR